MASLTQWMWVWGSSGSWRWTGNSDGAAVHVVTKSRTRLWLNWTELNWKLRVCVQLIIEEPLSALSDKFNVFVWGMKKKRVSVLQQWALASAISLRKMKEKLCNFLFCEHINALLLAAAVAVLPFSDLEDEMALIIADLVRMWNWIIYETQNKRNHPK